MDMEKWRKIPTSRSPGLPFPVSRVMSVSTLILDRVDGGTGHEERDVGERDTEPLEVKLLVVS